VKKGSIRKKSRRSYRRTTIAPTVARRQVEFLSDVALNMKFKKRFFSKLTNVEYAQLVKLGAALYTVGFEAAGGVVK